MKVFASVVVVSFLCVFGATVGKSEPPDTPVSVELVDGSRIVGTSPSSPLSVRLPYGEVKVPLRDLYRVDSDQGDSDRGADQAASHRVELRNGDVMTGQLQSGPFTIDALFGKVTLPWKHVSSIEVTRQGFAKLPTTRGLVLYYPLDRVGDGVVLNRVSKMHAGKPMDVTWLKQGLRGGAVEFTGSGKIVVPHDQELCPQQFTLAAWIRPIGRQGGYHMVVGKTDSSSWNKGYGFIRMPGDEKNIYFFVNSYTGSVVKAEISPTGWTHVAGVCDGSQVTLYINGVAKHTASLAHRGHPDPGADSVGGANEGAEPDEAQEPTVEDNPLANGVTEGSKDNPFGDVVEATDGRNVSVQHSTADFIVGSDSRGYAWTGAMDELVLYSRSLSARDIASLYRATRPPTVRPLEYESSTE